MDNVIVDGAEIERRILNYLSSVESADEAEIHRRVYRGGFPVIGRNETHNALWRLSKRGIVHVAQMHQQGYFRQKLWAVTKEIANGTDETGNAPAKNR